MLIISTDPIAKEIKRSKKPTLPTLQRKLFQNGRFTECHIAVKALMEVEPKTRTPVIVVHSEREHMAQNKLYEEEMSKLRLLIEVEKLKDLCPKQRQEFKVLKDAVLFPKVMNSQLLEGQVLRRNKLSR